MPDTTIPTPSLPNILPEAAEDIVEEKVLFEWSAPERPFQARNRDFWITAIAILVLVSVIFIMVQEFYLVIALISVMFLYYVLSTVPPENVSSKLTNRGVYFGDVHYEWDILERFWFGKNLGWDSVFMETKLRFPRQISIIIDPSKQDEIAEIVKKRIPQIDSSPSFVDKLTKWFAARLPLETRIEANTNSKQDKKS